MRGPVGDSTLCLYFIFSELSIVSVHTPKYKEGIYFITFTCHRWLPLIDISDGYSSVYRFFEVQSGQYWLQVKDSKGCLGIDSILVLPKECLKGFFMPTAFTPNNDGKNDILKPVLLGNVKQYQFWIYNRWGQVVFHSVDLSKGWDGTYKQLNQDGNVFVWVCTYQFESEPLQSKKGTFVLIR